MKSIFIEKLLETAACYEDKVALVDLDGSRSTTYGQLLALAKKSGCISAPARSGASFERMHQDA